MQKTRPKKYPYYVKISSKSFSKLQQIVNYCQYNFGHRTKKWNYCIIRQLPLLWIPCDIEFWFTNKSNYSQFILAWTDSE